MQSVSKYLIDSIRAFQSLVFHGSLQWKLFHYITVFVCIEYPINPSFIMRSYSGQYNSSTNIKQISIAHNEVILSAK